MADDGWVVDEAAVAGAGFGVGESGGLAGVEGRLGEGGGGEGEEGEWECEEGGVHDDRDVG